MRENIHPKYETSTVTCACGTTFQTRSTRPSIHVEICSNCHPFFTGKQKLIDSAGRVEKFTKRFEKTSGHTIRVKAKTKAAKSTPSVSKIMTTTARKPKPGEAKKSTEKKTKSETTKSK